MELHDNLSTKTCWELVEDRFDPDGVVDGGSTFMIGNGYYGYRGTHADWGPEQYVGFVVSDTYDKADGKWKELCTVPNPLFVELSDSHGSLSCLERQPESYRRELNFRYSEQLRELSVRTEGAILLLREERFALRDRLHGLLQRTIISADRACSVRLCCGIHAEVWSLNGNHFSTVEGTPAMDHVAEPSAAGACGFPAMYTLLTGEDELPIAVGMRAFLDGVEITPNEEDEYGLWRRLEIELRPNTPQELSIYAAVFSANDLPNNAESLAGDTSITTENCCAYINDLCERGYETLQAESRTAWDELWEDCDIQIIGDDKAQTLLRYNLYHNIIATPMHTEYLPIGARGLSCQAYQGAAFWDQEIFNMPMFLFTRPEVARNILRYRYHTLAGARAKARDLGYKGAFYAWVSGKDGYEICPSYFFEDVLSGRPIRNHFNDWQMHISPDIAYAVFLYHEVTDDWLFMVEYGAEIVFEVARFLQSFVYYKPEKARYELIRLLGPDEYHENVDNNFFTAFQTQFALSRAAALYRELQQKEPERLSGLQDKLGLVETDIAFWQEIAEKLHVQRPNSSGVIEQFDGFFRLEDTRPSELEKRIIDPGEYWGWPNGVAVETQVSKQADVCQTFVLHRDAFSVETMRANYEYYEPRTQHGSSLSPPVHAMVAAWVGERRSAYEYFIRTCGVDVFSYGKSVSGGTFIGGIHTASCGAAWQVVVYGFAGMRPRGELLVFHPMLPEGCHEIAFAVCFRSQRMRLRVDRRSALFSASEDNTGPMHIGCVEQELVLNPGIELKVDLPPDLSQSERKR